MLLWPSRHKSGEIKIDSDREGVSRAFDLIYWLRDDYDITKNAYVNTRLKSQGERRMNNFRTHFLMKLLGNLANRMMFISLHYNWWYKMICLSGHSNRRLKFFPFGAQQVINLSSLNGAQQTLSNKIFPFGAQQSAKSSSLSGNKH